MPLTLGLGECVEPFPLELLGQRLQFAPALPPTPTPRASTFSLGTRTLPVSPSCWAGSPLSRVSVEGSSHLWLHLLVRALCLGP